MGFVSTRWKTEIKDIYAPGMKLNQLAALISNIDIVNNRSGLNFGRKGASTGFNVVIFSCFQIDSSSPTSYDVDYCKLMLDVPLLPFPPAAVYPSVARIM